MAINESKQLYELDINDFEVGTSQNSTVYLNSNQEVQNEMSFKLTEHITPEERRETKSIESIGTLKESPRMISRNTSKGF